jgi:hypothetical protein
VLATAVTFPVTSPDMIYKKRTQELSWIERHKKRNREQDGMKRKAATK